MLRKALAGLAVIGAAVVGAATWGQWSLDQMVRGEVEALTRDVGGPSAERFTYDKLAGLPEPVQRFFRASVAEGTPLIKYVHLKQTGYFQPSPNAGWKPFRADQWYSVEPPRFVWQANMDFAPLVPVVGRDKYWSGQSNMLMKVLGMIPVVDARGPDLERSSLIRYVSEAIWFPTALLPGAHVQWAPIDSNSAQITFRDGGLSTAAIYTFDDSGLPVSFRSEERVYGGGDGKTPYPWWGRFGGAGFKEVAPGVRIATEGSAGWDLPEGEYEYIRLQITEVEYR